MKTERYIQLGLQGDLINLQKKYIDFLEKAGKKSVLNLNKTRMLKGRIAQLESQLGDLE